MTIHVAPDLSRRHFLIATSALGIAAGIAPNRLIPPAWARAPEISDAEWGKLEKALDGPLLGAKDSRFAGFAAPFNLYFDTAKRQPTRIALCANRLDVATAVKWAADHGINPVVRSGGHSYAGYSMGCGLMIDVSLLKRFSWDGSRTELTVESGARTELTVESGARNGDVYNVLRAEGCMLTHGRCPTVGIAGFLLGGGIGFNMRLHGVGSDHLAASTIVTADGKTLRLSAQENENLFWACQGGGGGNFGINTSFTVTTVPVDRVTVFHIQWATSRDKAERIALALMTALDGADNRLGSRFKFFRDRTKPAAKEAGVDLLGQFHGPERDVQALLRGVLSLAQATVEIEEMDYWDGQDFLLDWEGPFQFTERSMFLTKNLGAAAIDTAFERLWEREERSSDPDRFADVRFFQTGGRMNEIPAAATAFVHRDSRWLMDFGLPWAADDLKDPNWLPRSRQWLDGLFDAMAQYGNGKSYQNFVDPALKNWAEAYYGDNLGRLRQIKRDYDPNGLFKFAQSIPPAPDRTEPHPQH